MIVPINVYTVPEQLAILKRPAVKGDIGIASLLAFDLEETAKSHAPNCVGLASNQIWTKLDEPTPHVFVAFVEGKWQTFINATSLRAGERVSMDEGCMSKPGLTCKTKRRTRITVTYVDETGKSKKAKFKGFDAIIIQHELDHMNGTLI
ncbi:MAG: peptide deformylase [Candidatus Paceibacterota bacterium]|jgi:peptide deformylase